MKYIKLSIRNLEPLCISDDSTSQSGQTSCIRYIPGTTIRGYVINALSKDREWFEKNKGILFSLKVRFLNAYPSNEEKELIPSLKGFYERKTADGSIRNVVINGEFDEGMKRAGLGRFCHLNEDTIEYYNVETDSMMKILTNAEEQKVFRGEYLCPGYVFTGFIAVDEDVDEELLQKISNTFKKKYVAFGNRRSQGFGKCRIKVSDDKEPEICGYLPKSDVTGEVYMVLLSHMTMRGEDGEYCGINLNRLAFEMGVKELDIRHSATSLVTIHGYNSTLGIKLPTVPMYEQGSVFKLSFEGAITKEKMRTIVDKGLGERLNEGFGRVVFFDGSYASVNKKKEGMLITGSDIDVDVSVNPEDQKVITKVAGFYYRKLLESAKQKRIPQDKKRMKITKSLRGTVLSILEKNRYNPDVAEIVSRYFTHAGEKEDNQNIQKERVSIKGFSKAVMDILQTDNIGIVLGVDKEEVMGCRVEDLITSEESRSLIIGYLIDLIKYAGKED